MSNLYEIDCQIDELTEKMIDPETGEINEAILEELDQLEIEKKAKIEYLALKAKNIRSDVAALTAERDHFNQRIKTSQNKADRIETYISNILKGDKFSTSKVDISWRKSESVEVLNEAIIPEQYVGSRVVTKPDKKVIREALKSGKSIPGVRLIESNNMSIK